MKTSVLISTYYVGAFGSLSGLTPRVIVPDIAQAERFAAMNKLDKGYFYQYDVVETINEVSDGQDAA